jgi:hypothetical protein
MSEFAELLHRAVRVHSEQAQSARVPATSSYGVKKSSVMIGHAGVADEWCSPGAGGFTGPRYSPFCVSLATFLRSSLIKVQLSLQQQIHSTDNTLFHAAWQAQIQ